jgi:molybdopterin/thiamine biosynthesis adenylyltransferase
VTYTEARELIKQALRKHGIPLSHVSIAEVKRFAIELMCYPKPIPDYLEYEEPSWWH